MLDLKFISENQELIQKNLQERNVVNVDLSRIIQLIHERSALLQNIEKQRAERNNNSRALKQPVSAQERTALIEKGKTIKNSIAKQEKTLTDVTGELGELSAALPNTTHPQTPRGNDETANTVLETVGNIPQFHFQPHNHVHLAQSLDLVDFDAATRVSGTKFYYLKNQAVILELALTRFAIDILQTHGYTPMITPDIAKTSMLQGIGFNPRGKESNIYNLEGGELSLIGTAEIPLGAYYANQTLPAESLPIRFSGLSHCFRQEAGAAGQNARGLYRVHQFSKVEMFIFCHPDESEHLHNELLSIEKEIFAALEIPFRVIDVCTGDLGASAYRKFDLEAWMPGRGKAGEWGEVTSASNCTDYQSRRLSIRFKGMKGSQYVHMLNGTAVAVTRAIIAILENFQQADGSICIPKALQPYTGFHLIRQ